MSVEPWGFLTEFQLLVLNLARAAWLFLNYYDVIKSPLFQYHSGFWEKEEAMQETVGLSEVFSKDLKAQQQWRQQQNKTKQNIIIIIIIIFWQFTAHSDLQSEVFEDKQ
jgi:hypothetical protein